MRPRFRLQKYAQHDFKTILSVSAQGDFSPFHKADLQNIKISHYQFQAEIDAAVPQTEF